MEAIFEFCYQQAIELHVSDAARVIWVIVFPLV